MDIILSQERLRRKLTLLPASSKFKTLNFQIVKNRKYLICLFRHLIKHQSFLQSDIKQDLFYFKKMIHIISIYDSIHFKNHKEYDCFIFQAGESLYKT